MKAESTDLAGQKKILRERESRYRPKNVLLYFLVLTCLFSASVFMGSPLVCSPIAELTPKCRLVIFRLSLCLHIWGSTACPYLVTSSIQISPTDSSPTSSWCRRETIPFPVVPHLARRFATFGFSKSFFDYCSYSPFD